MKRMQGKGFENKPSFKYQMLTTTNPFKMKGRFFKMKRLIILKFRILLSSGKE